MLQINDKFAIDADENQFILKEYGTVQDEKSKNYGEKTIMVLGYYSTLEQAINGLEKILQRRAIKNKDLTLKSVVGQIRAIHDDVFSKLKGE